MDAWVSPVGLVLGLVLTAVGLVVLALAVREVRRLRADVAALEERATDLADEIDALPPEVSGTGARHLISVEILNLFELAHKESAFTRPFTALTPRVLRDVVHRRIVGRVRQSLDEQGVQADVRLHRAR